MIWSSHFTSLLRTNVICFGGGNAYLRHFGHFTPNALLSERSRLKYWGILMPCWLTNTSIIGTPYHLNSLQQVGLLKTPLLSFLPLDRACAMTSATPQRYSWHITTPFLWHRSNIFFTKPFSFFNGCCPPSADRPLLSWLSIWKETTFPLISFLNCWHAIQTVSNSRCRPPCPSSLAICLWRTGCSCVPITQCWGIHCDIHLDWGSMYQLWLQHK